MDGLHAGRQQSVIRMLAASTTRMAGSTRTMRSRWIQTDVPLQTTLNSFVALKSAAVCFGCSAARRRVAAAEACGKSSRGGHPANTEIDLLEFTRVVVEGATEAELCSTFSCDRKKEMYPVSVSMELITSIQLAVALQVPSRFKVRSRFGEVQGSRFKVQGTCIYAVPCSMYGYNYTRSVQRHRQGGGGRYGYCTTEYSTYDDCCEGVVQCTQY